MKKISFWYVGIIALGLLFVGFFPGYYYYKSKFNYNAVTVKGLAETDVEANLAIWEIKFVATGNDVVKTKNDLEKQTDAIVNFLHDNGFNDNEIEMGGTETNDLMANPYRGNETITSRFILTRTLTLRSNQVHNVAETYTKTGDLISQGVVFENRYDSPISYIFTNLNEIKPQLLETATKNARQAALEFAKSSDSKVGKIHSANQGVISILPRDNANAPESQQINKRVRVVATVEYFLE
ncbi:MAG: SIMPL domain-containing protein [Alphaproteobacteria bacterium]|nr:SIMPL domain-containing protein [Alphaproteobacteria bacterium]